MASGPMIWPDRCGLHSSQRVELVLFIYRLYKSIKSKIIPGLK
jgi:hypothetical protein